MINSKLSLRRSEADAGASLKCYHSERQLSLMYLDMQLKFVTPYPPLQITNKYQSLKKFLISLLILLYS